MSDQNKKMELENIPACLVAHEMEDNPKNANDTNKYLFLKAIELSPSKLSAKISDRTLNSENDDELVHKTNLNCEKLNENDSLRFGICYAEKGTKSADTDLHDIKADDMNLIPESPKLTQEKDVRFLSPLAVVYEYSVSQNTYSQSTQSLDDSECSQSLVEKCMATDQQESNKTEMEIALNPQEKIETEKSVEEHVSTESMTPGGDCHSTQLSKNLQKEKNVSSAIDLVDSTSTGLFLNQRAMHTESSGESKLAAECSADTTSINAQNVVTEYVAVGTKEILPIDSGAMQNIDMSKITSDTLSSSKFKETVTTELLAGQMSESIDESMCVTGINLVTGIRKENNIGQIMTNLADNDNKSSPEAIENQRVKSEDHSESIKDSVGGINLETGIRRENNIGQIITNLTDNDNKSSPEAIENQRVKSEDHLESIKDSADGINLESCFRRENNIGLTIGNLTDNDNKSSPEAMENQRVKSEDLSESIKDSVNGINLETGFRRENTIGQIMTNLTDNDNKSSPEAIENQRVKSENHSESIKDSINGINLETGFRRENTFGLTITNLTDNDSKSSPEAIENQGEQTADHSQNCSQHLFPDSNPDLLQSGKRNTDDVSEESNMLAESTESLRDNVSDIITEMNNNSKTKEAHDTDNQDTGEPGCAVEIDRMVDSEETIGSSEGFTVSINDSQNNSQNDLFEDDPTSKTFVQETEKNPCNTSKDTITPQKLSVCDTLKEVGEKNMIKYNTLNEKQNNPLQLNEDIENSDIGIADTTCKINTKVLHGDNVSINDTLKRKLSDREHEPSPKRKRVLDESTTLPQIYTESSPKATEVKSADHSENCSQDPSSDSNLKLLRSGKRNTDAAVPEDLELAESNQTLQDTLSDIITEMNSYSKTKEAHDTDNQDTREPGHAVEIDRMLDSETIGSSEGSNKSVNDSQNNSQKDLFGDDPTCKTFVQETEENPSNTSRDTNKLQTFSGSDTLKEEVEKNTIEEDTLNEHQNIKTNKSELHEDIEHSNIGVVDATCKSNKMFLHDDNVSMTVTEKRKLSDGEQEQITKRNKVLDELSVMRVPQKHKTSRDANNEIYAKIAKLSDDQSNLEYQAILGEKETNCMIETLVTLASKAVNNLEENTVWTGRSNESLINETNVKYEKYHNEISKNCEQTPEITNIDKELSEELCYSKDKAETKRVLETQNEDYKDNVYSTELNFGTKVILENDSNISTSKSTKDELVLKRDNPGSKVMKMHTSQETKLSASPVFISAREYSQGSTGFEPTDLSESVVMSSQGSAQSVPFAGNHSMMEVSEDGVQTTDIINNSGRLFVGSAPSF